MNTLRAILGDWKSWTGIGAIVAALVIAISERLRKIVIKVLTAYVASKWRLFWYWITNRSFWVSSTANFDFPANITSQQQLLDQFNDALRQKVTPQVEGQLAHGNLTLILKEVGKAPLEITADSGSSLAAQLDGTDGFPNDGSVRPPQTRLTVQTGSRLVINYRDFKRKLGYLRQTLDQIHDEFAKLVGNQVNSQRNVYVDVFFREDQKVDTSVRQVIPASDPGVDISRVNGMTHFGATRLDQIIEYLPQFLVRETISDLMKRHGVVT